MTSPPYLIVATPCYGGQVTTLFMTSMLTLQKACRERGLRFAYAFESGDALITRVRANLMTQFLDAPETTHLLFIDADIGFKPEHVFRLLDADHDVAAGSYPLKHIDWEKLGHRVAEGGRAELAAGLNYVGVLEAAPNQAERDGFVRAKSVANGFLMVKREALLRMCEAYPKLRYKQLHGTASPEDVGTKENRHRVALFDTMIDPDTRAYLPEDYAFCRRWRDLGGEVWLDTRSMLTHVGSMQYGGESRTPATKP